MARPEINIVWLKRDLRLSDHAPLRNAIEAGKPILLIYIFEPSLMQNPHYDIRHWRFVMQSLKEMQQVDKLNYAISVCHQEAEATFRQILRFYVIDQVFSYQEIGIRATFDRDLKLQKLFQEKSINWQESPHQGVIRGLKQRDGWAKHWHQVMKAEQEEVDLPRLQELSIQLSDTNQRAHQALKGKPLPREILYSMPEGMQSGGESLAKEYLHSFLAKRIKGYRYSISNPIKARKAGSRLSPYLAWGNVSMRQVYQAYQQAGKEAPEVLKKDLRAFGSRLRWQAHFIQKFESEDRIEFENLNPAFDRLDQEFNPEFFEAWKNGQTGVPLVDACMRCLKETGFLNFRMRAMVVSFWCHYLWQPWQPAAEYLASQFLDFEPGIHYSQIQMQAGVTGINTIRIYNPVKQAKDQDADGKFVLKWVPELKKLPKHFMLEPWTLRPLEQMFNNLTLGEDYPHPLVNLKKAHSHARQTLWSVKGSASAEEFNKAILKKHVEPKRKPTKKKKTEPKAQKAES